MVPGHLFDRARKVLRRAAFFATVPPLRRWLRGRHEAPHDIPPVGLVRWGDLRRLEPISTDWGDDRGGAVDRHYIEHFLQQHAADVRGHVLEVGDDAYTRRFGGEAVRKITILEYPGGGSPGTTLVRDLARADGLPIAEFDCVIAPQTLQFIFDVRSAVANLYRMLKPGGVALVTVPGISHVPLYDPWSASWCWNFTALSMRRLFGAHFDSASLDIRTHGNVLAATSFLFGMGRGELSIAELDHIDPDYEVVITVRAVKTQSSAAVSAPDSTEITT
jgi:SAM-dependent methyltransferase